MLIAPHIPIRTYITLDITEFAPNKADTKLKSKRPTNAQFNAPIILNTSAVFLYSFHNQSSFLFLLCLTFYKIYMNN